VLAEGAVVGRVFLSPAAPDSRPWMWTLAYGYHETAHRRTATSRRATLRWRHSLRAGGGSRP
jgi:hypothetical protein